MALSRFKHTVFIEFNKHVCDLLSENFDSAQVFFGDIKDFDLGNLEQIDVVAEGLPCQLFSLGGKHQTNQDS